MFNDKPSQKHILEGRFRFSFDPSQETQSDDLLERLSQERYERVVEDSKMSGIYPGKVKVISAVAPQKTEDDDPDKHEIQGELEIPLTSEGELLTPDEFVAKANDLIDKLSDEGCDILPRKPTIAERLAKHKHPLA